MMVWRKQQETLYLTFFPASNPSIPFFPKPLPTPNEI